MSEALDDLYFLLTSSQGEHDADFAKKSKPAFLISLARAGLNG